MRDTHKIFIQQARIYNKARLSRSKLQKQQNSYGISAFNFDFSLVLALPELLPELGSPLFKYIFISIKICMILF